MTDLFGTDIACDATGGVGPTFDLASGLDGLIEAVMRRFETERGTLIDDPNYGLDVTDWVGKRTDTAQLFAWQQQLEAEAKKEQRILRARASITTDDQTQALRFTLACTTAQGPFSLTVGVSAVSVDLLAVEK